MALIPARIKDEDFISEVDRYKSDPSHFHLWWLGQSGFLLLWKGKKLLLDPYLSDSLTRKYASTNKPHVRLSEKVVDPALLKGIAMVSSSHNHTDHLDAETLLPVIRNNPEIQFIIPEANRKFVADRLGMSEAFFTGLNDGLQIQTDEFTFHGVPASHNEIERDENGNSKFMGYVIRFGGWSIYHSGDTLWYDGISEILKPYSVDLALLPINGNDPARGVAGNLNAEEAAALGKAIGARLVIPCHYDMFAFNTADPDHFADAATRIVQPYCILEIGGHFSSESLPLQERYIS